MRSLAPRFMIATVLALVMVTPVSAQRLTPNQVGEGFVEAVALCAKATLAGDGIAALGEADRALVAEGDAQARAFVRSPEGRPVWDVLFARGIVLISEPEDHRCDVIACGPRVEPVFNAVTARLRREDLDFSVIDTPQTPSAIVRVYERVSGETRVEVRLDGGEPGMPGRTFRFPMLLAFVASNAVNVQ